MLKRRIVAPPEYLYPPDEWSIIETRYHEEHQRRAETVFALSNGYLGVRGVPDEGRPAFGRGTFVNGFYESWPIHHPEQAYGLAGHGQTMVAVPDATTVQLYIDDEPFFLPVANCREYARTLDMGEGVLRRTVLWSTPAGRHVRIRSSRLVSFDQRHLLVISFEVTVLDHPCPVTVASRLVNTQDAGPDRDVDHQASADPRVAAAFDHLVLIERIRQEDRSRLLLGYETANSRMRLGVGVQHTVETACPCSAGPEPDEEGGLYVLTAKAVPGQPIRLTKYVAYHTSRTASPTEVAARAQRTLERVCRSSFGELSTAHRNHLRRGWARADIELRAHGPGGRRVQQAVRWNLFQLLQASWHAEGTGIPAKALTSQAYEGHYFWDTEMYVLPFLTYTQPRIARNLLRFRHSMLDRARARAGIMSNNGALFPWRTINGEEASANYLAGTAQFHINADIAYAIRRYVDVRGDRGFLAEAGAEILVETARFWADFGFFDDGGAFHLHGVTGPDEYTTLVNDNTYTNLMARLNLQQAASAVRELQASGQDAYQELDDRCHLLPGEVEQWERIALAMHIPYDQRRGINPQDQAFLERERWDLATTPTERFPLLLHYHPLVIYRRQVLKQADVVLAMVLLGDEFSLEQKRRNFDYYDLLTTGDSSLSAGIESILAAEIGYEAKAIEYFTYALLADLADSFGDGTDGVHLAAAGSTWMSLVFGFGGVRDFGGRLRIDPRLPGTWESLVFPIRYRDRQLRVSLTADEERYRLEEGSAVEVTIRGEAVVLQPGREHVIRRDLPPPGGQPGGSQAPC